MRSRIDAAERLTLSGAVAPACAVRRLPLRGARGLRRASGTGPRAVQALDAALDAGRPARGARSPRWPPRTPRFSARGLRVALAREYAGPLARLDPDGAAPRGAPRPWPSSCSSPGRRRRGPARGAGGRPPRSRRFSRVAGRRAVPPTPSHGDLARRRARRAQPPTSPADDREARLAATSRRAVARGRRSSPPSTSCRRGAAVDPPALRAALLTLRLAGQDASARTIALQTLLAGRRSDRHAPGAWLERYLEAIQAERDASRNTLALLRPRSQRLRGLPDSAGPRLRHAPAAPRSRPTSSTRTTAAWRRRPGRGGCRRSASSTASPSSKAGARTTRRR